MDKLVKPDSLFLAGSLVLALAAVVTDLRRDSVPNTLVLTGVITGFFFRFITDGPSALPDAAAGLFLPFLFPGILFFLGMLGAGDVKLLMAMGVFLGWHGILRVTAAAFLFGGVQALFLVLRRGNARKRLACLVLYLKRCAQTRRLDRYDASLPEGAAGKWGGGSGQMHFTVSILAGLIWYIALYGG